MTIPGNGTPTGIVNNGLGGFNGDAFLFVSEDGTISGWRPALGTAAETLVPGVTNSVYKGVTLASTANGPDFAGGEFPTRARWICGDGTNLPGVGFLEQFSDSRARAHAVCAPFGIQSVDGVVFVTFAKQDDAKHDDVADRGNGLIDIFDPQAGRFHRFATGSNAGGTVDQMNSPPEAFG